MTLDPELARLANANSGLITRGQASAEHVSPAVLRACVRDGALVRIRSGLFVLAEKWTGAAPHERLVLTARGLLLGHATWMVSHHAALAVHGLPLHDVDLGLVDVVAPVVTSRPRRGLHVHRATPEQLQRGLTHPLRVVSPADACVLTAAASGYRAGVVAMDGALHRGLVTTEELQESLRTTGVRYGVGQCRAAMEAADPLSESPGESLTRIILTGAGLSVRSQVEIRDAHGFIGRVDLLVDERVIVEFDGALKYAGQDGRRALMAEKKREERLRDAGYRIVRVTWAELGNPAALVRRVRQQLAR